MLNILFVCLGNICRSPMAEGIFTQLVEEAGLSDQIMIDSAGTASYHIGSLPDKRAILVCRENGIQLRHKARAFKPGDFTAFHYIIPMDLSNLKNVEHLRPHDATAVVKIMREFDHPKNAGEVPDPYYGEIAGFYEVYDLLHLCCSNFLDYLIQTYGLQGHEKS